MTRTTDKTQLYDTDRDFLRVSIRKSYYWERSTLAAALLRAAGHLKHPALLDVGCGMKPYEACLAAPGDRYWGVDYPVTMDGSYADATRAEVFADCLRLPFADNAFDSVISTQVLEHVRRPDRMIEEMARVLKGNGTLLLSAPMTWPLHEEPHDFFRYTIHGLRELLKSARLEPIDEIRRGDAPTTLAQLFLDTHLERPLNIPLLGKLYGNALCAAVNALAGAASRLRPSRRLCLGWVVVARKT